MKFPECWPVPPGQDCERLRLEAAEISHLLSHTAREVSLPGEGEQQQMDKYHYRLSSKAKETLEGEQENVYFGRDVNFSGMEAKITKNAVKCLISESPLHFKYFCT